MKRKLNSTDLFLGTKSLSYFMMFTKRLSSITKIFNFQNYLSPVKIKKKFFLETLTTYFTKKSRQIFTVLPPLRILQSSTNPPRFFPIPARPASESSTKGVNGRSWFVETGNKRSMDRFVKGLEQSLARKVAIMAHEAARDFRP